MKSLIVAREKEQAVFERLLNEPTAQMLVVYGRRRTGKTFLVREYFDDRFAFKHTAVSPTELKDRDNEGELLYRVQLNEFAASLRKYGSKDESPIRDWFEAFHRLEALLEKKRGKDKMVVFIDELPWLDTPRANFLSAFEHFWNDWGSGKHNLLLVVCGSATSWMLDNLINNKGGLYGRTNCEVHLHPFTLTETETYLHNRGVTLDRYDVVQTYMLTGGTLSDMLKALVKSDLVSVYWNFGESKRTQYYKLTDMFCLFYLGFVQKNPSSNRTFWRDNQNSPKLNSWRGRAFEDVCFVHQMEVKRTLVTTYGLKKNMYSSRVQRVVTLEGLFA